MKACCGIFGIIVAACVAYVVHLGGVQEKIHHAATIGWALRTMLFELEQSDFDAFLNSYDVFDEPQSNKSDEVKIRAVYKVLAPMMALGSLTKYYIPPVMDPSKKSFTDIHHNMLLFEHMLADSLLVNPGKTVLDIGCGSGHIADVVQERTGAKVHGINISPEQIARARAHAEKSGKLGNLLDFQVASMNDRLPFEDNSIDAVYDVQAALYAHDPKALAKEINRVLKPGGIFADCAPVSLENYNPQNQTHVRMMKNAQRVMLHPGSLRPRKAYVDAATANGLTLKTDRLLGAADFTQSAIDYFNPLGSIIRLLGSIGLVSKSFVECLDRMNQYGLDLLLGEREELFTINYWLVYQSASI